MSIMTASKQKHEITKHKSETLKVESESRIVNTIRHKFSSYQGAVKYSRTDNHPDGFQKILDKTNEESLDLFQAVGAKDVVTAMLATQMAAVHDLQQKTYYLARISDTSETIQNQTNLMTKLSNVFIQQVSLLQKLQGKGQQKVIIEHVHVHNGGQAIVGNVEPDTGEAKGEK